MARLFNATSSDYLRNDSAPVTLEPLTMACWFRTTSIATATGQMIWIGASGGSDFFGLARRTATVRLSINTISVQGTTETSVGPWFHACGTVVGTTRLCYINGILVATGATTAAIPLLLDRISIGRQDGSTAAGFHGGDIAEVGVWSAGLSAAEVLLLAQGMSPTAVLPASLVFYAPLYGAASPEPDLMSGARNLTVNGTAASAHPWIHLPRPAMAPPIAA